jgi:sugar lactone lactonase YvrE
MKIDSKGNIYVAQWFGGKVLKLSPDGNLLHIFDIAAGDGTTNVAFSEGEKELYVTVVKDPKGRAGKGEHRKNRKCEVTDSFRRRIPSLRRRRPDEKNATP